MDLIRVGGGEADYGLETGLWVCLLGLQIYVGYRHAKWIWRPRLVLELTADWPFYRARRFSVALGKDAPHPLAGAQWTPEQMNNAVIGAPGALGPSGTYNPPASDVGRRDAGALLTGGSAGGLMNPPGSAGPGAIRYDSAGPGADEPSYPDTEGPDLPPLTEAEKKPR